MKNNDLRELFVAQLQDMSSSENQIVKFLTTMIQKSSNEDLKKALTTYLQGSKQQVERIERICSDLDVENEKKLFSAMKGILRESKEITENKSPSLVLDAALIIAAQKIKHYKIATYGALLNFSKQLELDAKVTHLLQETLDEECGADKKLTKIAVSSLFAMSASRLATPTPAGSRR